LGCVPGSLAPGPLNAITDVMGVRVGHTTIVRGESIRTGVTAILPHAGNLFREKGPRRGVRRQRLRQAGRIDAGE
jgi:D-aminopeptidase